MKAMMRQPAIAAILVVALASLLRLIFAGFTGLGIDESYMVAASSHFSWSYFDHPPISWWLELAARWIFGSEAPLVVRLPFVLLSAVSSWLIFALTQRLYGSRAAFWALLAYNISPVFSLAFGCWVLPDGPLDVALLAAAYALSRALGIPEKPDTRWWLAAGVFAGLALLCKYNAALTLAGAVLVLLTDQVSRRQLRRWQPWAAGLLAAAMFMPVIAWNFQHGWQSFHYQSGRAAGLKLHFFAPFTIWGGEALFLLPWLWLPMILRLAHALRSGPGERRGWMLAMLGVIPVVLFAIIGIWSSTRILYHWATPGYLLLFPLLGDWAARWKPWPRNMVAAASAVFLAMAAMLITAEIHIGFIKNLDLMAAPGKSPLLQAVDWDSVRGQIPPGLPVAALRWYDAGKIGYALRGANPMTVFGPEPHEFGILAPPAKFLGRDMLLLAMPGDESDILKAYAPDFKSLKPGGTLTVTHHGAVLLEIPVLDGHYLLKAP